MWPRLRRTHISVLAVAGVAIASVVAYEATHSSAHADVTGGAGPRLSPARSASSRRPTHAKLVHPTRAETPRAQPDARCAHRSWNPAPALTYAGLVTARRVLVRSRPGSGSVIARLSRIDANGYPTVFAILGAAMRGCTPMWFRVQLSVAPNGRSGWVRPWTLSTFAVHTRIVVQLSHRRLIAYRNGKRVLTAPVAVGRADAPTPVGRFFVDGRFVLRDSSGPFGVAALSVSAHSNAPTGWPRGRPIALHGTNDPASIGQAASHGCIRLDNAYMRRLFALVPAGTPVLIAS